MYNQKGYVSVLILGIIVLSLGVFFFVPLPYYQSTPVLCKDGGRCPHVGWNLGTTLYNQLFPKGTNGNPRETNQEKVNQPSDTDKSNWKTYTNKRYGFSFQYPSDFSVEEQGDKIAIWFPKPTGELDQDKIDLTIEENSKGLSPQEIVEADIRDLRKKDQTLQFVADKEERSLKPYKNGDIDGVTFQSGADYDFDIILFTHNSYSYTFSSSHYDLQPGQMIAPQETINKIISSFKFLELNSSTSTINITTDKPLILYPSKNEKIASPLFVKGIAPSGWLFEGQLIVKLLDEKKKVIGQGVAKEEKPGTWSSGEPVAFEGNIPFSTTAKSGFVVIENDNPSGLPENQKMYEIPVNF